MANFIALVDPDPERRSRFLSRVAPLVPPFEGLVAGSCEAPPFAALWAADEHAPISVASGNGAAAGEGSAPREGSAVILGTAIRGEQGTPVEAHQLRDLWHGADSNAPEPFDGYYAALAYDPHAGLLAGADVLGRFPLYYYSSGDVLLVGSSPELFQHHPSFRKAFDPHGLVGILLINGLVEGRTLWAGVRRLGAGQVLVATPGHAPREMQQYRLPLSERYFNVPFEQQVEALEAALDSAIRRQVPRTPRPVLMLSGGLDSRAVAGFLARQGISPLAVSHGLPQDVEMKCAVSVARKLRFEQHCSESDASHYLEDVKLRVAWEHLASGFSGTGGWGNARALRALGTRQVSGHAMDLIIGGAFLGNKKLGFETQFRHSNRWGLQPPMLERLLRRDVFGDAVAEVMAELRRRYESYSDEEFRRIWCFMISHRQRYHIGSFAWPTSFGAWPIWPAVDMKVLEVAGGLPASSLDGRRIEIALMCTKFPELAALPLDRNSYNMDPLLPSFAYKARRYVRRRVQRVMRRFVPERAPSVERRRYYRQFDVNGAGWRAVREAAEPWRKLGLEYFDARVLDEVVPGPGERAEYADVIAGSGGMKTVLGFLLWLERAGSGAAAER